MRFQGSDSYVTTEDLTLAVNAAVMLQRPLLIKREPGTGKTRLAEEVAASLGLELLEWHIKSTTKAQQGLYEYDAVSRLRDSQLGDPRVKDIANYIVKGTLRVKIGDAPEQLCGPGTLLYFPANVVHSTVATADEDVIFFTVKDMSHGIIGKAADGTMTGGYYEKPVTRDR